MNAEAVFGCMRQSLFDSLLLVICEEKMMTRSLSAGLRQRMFAAIEDGMSMREAARRFRIRISAVGI